MHRNSSRLFIVFEKKAFTIFFCFFSLFISANAQWVNDPGLNTKLVIDGSNPQNIHTATDGQGGGFIVLQDNRTETDKIYFTHFDSKGKSTLRADGKNVSSISGIQMNPVSSPCIQNSCVIVWQGEINNGKGEIFAQRVAPNGQLLWNNSGLQITDSENEVGGYYLCVDSEGNSFVSYLAKEPGFIGDYIIRFKKINAEGKIINSPKESFIYKSNTRKSSTAILKDDNDGLFSFWLENVNGKSVLKSLYLDSLKLIKSDRTPITVSDPKKDVLSYKVYKYPTNKVYIVWQQQGEEKILYHQLINSDEKTLWGIYGRKVSYSRGSKTNLQACVYGENIFVSWTNKLKNKQQVLLQRFDKSGASLWDDDLLLSGSSAHQFGQKMILDNKGGITISWFQNISDSVYADIYASRLSANGKQLWGEDELGVGTHFNSHKSYLSLVPDNSGGAIFIFKDKRTGSYGIYGQRVFITGTFVSQLVGFSADVEGDSVNISWYSVNEKDSIYYLIERMDQPDNSITDWEMVDSINSSYSKGLKNYFVTDFPQVNGTIYYRVTQMNSKGKELNSELTRVNYFSATSEIIVAQNNPNPFSDSTKISFFLPADTEISLKIFNSGLKKIYEINKRNYPQGKNEIYFSADNLAPGIYFYKFKADNFVDVKKMVIAK